MKKYTIAILFCLIIISSCNQVSDTNLSESDTLNTNNVSSSINDEKNSGNESINSKDNVEQTPKTGVLYKADHWLDVAGKGGIVNAGENPTYENVEILKAEKNIFVTLGNKKLNYEIISLQDPSAKYKNYNVLLDGKSYVITMGMNPLDGTYAINIQGIWLVNIQISDITVIE